MERITYKEALCRGEARLAEAGVEEAALDAWLLFSWVTGISRAAYFMDRDCVWADREKQKQYEALIEKRARRIPLQYLTGVQQFMGLDFLVTPAVLIPRQDTETLVEYALQRLCPGDRVLDLCTGSGCIGISLAKLGGARVWCADISEEALWVAQNNGKRLGLNEITWIRSDLLENINERAFDMIVSNPPYIPSGVIDGLMPEVRDHEPRLALDGEADGLYFYRRLAKECKDFLKPNGQLCLEIGYNQGEAVSGLLNAAGWDRILVHRDVAGQNRVVSAIWRGTERDGKRPADHADGRTRTGGRHV